MVAVTPALAATRISVGWMRPTRNTEHEDDAVVWSDARQVESLESQKHLSFPPLFIGKWVEQLFL